jgi:methionine sulfoxide reductase heme-binding subunit
VAGLIVVGGVGIAVVSHLLAGSVTSGPLLWYLTRATAFAAYLTLTAAVALGMLRTVARRAGERLSWVVDELHQFISALALLLVLAHLLSIFLDPFITFTAANLLLPLDEPYRPLAVRLGVFAFYGLLLVLISSWVRRRLRYGTWRALHYLGFVTFALATAHGVLAGSDAGEPWMRGVYVGAGSAVAFLTLVRLLAGTPRMGGERVAQVPLRR